VLSLALLLAQQVAGMEHKPPVTLLLVAGGLQPCTRCAAAAGKAAHRQS
jgi:hypothetical protein